MPTFEESKVGSRVPTGDSVAFATVLGLLVPITVPPAVGDIVLEALPSKDDVAVGDRVPDG